jgi:hypothetical protein
MRFGWRRTAEGFAGGVEGECLEEAEESYEAVEVGRVEKVKLKRNEERRERSGNERRNTSTDQLERPRDGVRTAAVCGLHTRKEKQPFRLFRFSLFSTLFLALAAQFAARTPRRQH